jgi:hypothetical protein
MGQEPKVLRRSILRFLLPLWAFDFTALLLPPSSLALSLLRLGLLFPPPSPIMAAAAAAAAAASTPQGVAERRGIPAAAFVEDVEAYLRQSGLDVNSALAFLQER